jgi:hypothetical protein
MSNYTTAYVIQSANLAMKIQDEYTKKAGRIDKGVHRQSIWVLWRTSMPSILTELGFLTNPLEEKFLASEKGQEYLAKSIFRGLRKYKDDVEGNKKEYNDNIENQDPLENENIKAGNLPNQKAPVEDEEEQDDAATNSTITPGTSQTTTATNPSTIEPMPEEKKEKINDGKYVDIELKKIDSSKVKSVEDSLKAKDIADKYKREQLEIEKRERQQKELKDKEQKEKELKDKTEGKNIKANITFKVQFASSDVELNLKQEKFKGVVDGAYYKMKNIFKYTSGNFTLIKDAVIHQNELREKGFKDCFIIAMKNGERIDINEARKELGQ